MSSERNTSMEDLVALCKRRGFIFPASEIYGGLNGFWDFGPLGVELKNNLRDAWWRDMVRNPPVGPDGKRLTIVGLDSAIIQNPRVWEASGHVSGFNDPMVDCRACKARFRADQLGEMDCPRKPSRRPGEHDGCDLTEPRSFNLMFRTFIGAASGEDNVAYLRPETAQGIFVNYKNVLDTMRVKIPFGIAQIGKAFRNEVTPRNFIFRSREFEQMEMEWFCHPDDAGRWYDYWVAARLEWWASLGVDAARLRRRDHDADELAHYSTACADVEYAYPFNAPGECGELEGIAHRGCFDLTQHAEHGQTKLEYFDQERNQRYIPHVIEPASGLTRGVLVLLSEAYREEWAPTSDGGGDILPAEPGKKPPEGYEPRVVMRFTPRMAPTKVAVFPLLKNKPGLVERARAVFEGLRARWPAFYDQVGAIGRRYRRQDEVGTPFCVTVDFETLENDTVTVRDRDSMAQERIAVDELQTLLDRRLRG
jgi:glycyl-tRNA synthetase